MPNLNRVNHNDLVMWLEKYWHGRESINLKIYRELEECPEFQQDLRNAQAKEEFYHYGSLPSDLVVIEKKSELPDTASDSSAKRHTANSYKLFFAISSAKAFSSLKKLEGQPFKYIKKRLSFYLYYFSRIVEPKRFSIINAIPKGVRIPRQFKDFCKENGFGIWCINTTAGNYQELCEPKSLSQTICDKFKEYIDAPEDLGETLDEITAVVNKTGISNLKGAVKGKAEDFTLFFEQYILDATDAIAGVKSGDFGRRYLDKKLLYKMYELRNISYRDTIIELVNEHLDEHMDDYQFVTEALNELWKKSLNIPYMTFLDTYEPALLHVFAQEKDEKYYRDHYIHQFQVFLLGLYFIDCFYERFKQYKHPEISWLIAATFHDMAYPIQKFDDWIDTFFEDVFLVPNLGRIELESNFVRRGFLRSFNHIIERFCTNIMKEKYCSKWLADENDILQSFYENITGPQKQHCLLSSISLLKLLYEKYPKKVEVEGEGFTEVFHDVIIPSALAIALHDKNVWGRLNNDEKWKSGRGNCPLPSLEFERDPLSFLLIFCDCAQEWGRPHLEKTRKSSVHKKRKEDEEEDSAGIFRLKNIVYSPQKELQVTLYSPKHQITDSRFIEKQDELKALQEFLIQPKGLEFTIYLFDKDGKGNKSGFPMIGACSS